jgi:selenocysteine lyase/cysteine desulfurase
MKIQRRGFIKGAGLLAGLGPLRAASAVTKPQATPPHATTPRPSQVGEPQDWNQLRSQFEQDFSWRNFAGFLLASRPRIVEQDIEYHRTQLNLNAPNYLPEVYRLEGVARSRAGEYLGADASQISLTANTTMGLATLYNGIQIRPDQEVLSTEHEHYSCVTSLRYRSEREGFRVNTIRLYDEPRNASSDEMLARIRKNVTDKTRVLALTWVHSGSSIKLPAAEVSKLVKELNQGRAEDDRLLFCLDGVHGFGVENTSFDELGCDFFVAGTHKWMFGPSGTGIMCSRDSKLSEISPTIPPFNLSREDNFGAFMTPGGFHAFEHRCALPKAFEFHLQLGKERVQNRIHHLNNYLKDQLEELEGVQLVTPPGSTLSAGFTFFRVPTQSPKDVVAILKENKIIASAADRDAGPVVRMAPGILNSEEEIDATIVVLRKIASPTS